jgi:hypothetical protein
VKNVAKGEDVIKETTDQTYAFVDEYIQEAIKSSIMYVTDGRLKFDHLWNLDYKKVRIMN